MNLQFAAIAGSGNPLKSRFESEIRAKKFSKSADPFAYSPPPLSFTLTSLETSLQSTIKVKSVGTFPEILVKVVTSPISPQTKLNYEQNRWK